MLLLSQQPAELCNAIQYAKVLSLVKKLKVFGQAFFKRVVGVWGQSHRDTTCAPLLEVRGEMLEVRNSYATFEQSHFPCGLDRGKKQENAFYSFAQTFSKRLSCLLLLNILLLIGEPPLVVAHISLSAFHYGTPNKLKSPINKSKNYPLPLATPKTAGRIFFQKREKWRGFLEKAENVE